MSASLNATRTLAPSDAVRCAWVDVAKGLCIVLVVMMHSTLGTGEAMGGEGFMHHVVAFAKPFRIPDFFLLSGLFLGRVIGRDWRLFADRRVVHFAYFYVIWVLIQSVVKAGPIVEGTDGAAGALSAFGLHLAWALVEPYSTLWFIYLLAVFSVVTKFLHKRLHPLALVAGAAVLQSLPLHGVPYLLEEFCGRYVYFLIGFVFAERIFDIAQWVRGHVGPALAGLALWAALNAALAFTNTGFEHYPTLASLPVVSLVIGSLGAMAIVAVAALLTEAGGSVTRALRACGERSIVIYLAFFLPMALTRGVMVRADLDVGLASLIVTAVAVVTPLAFARLIRGTRLSFLFHRPAAFHIADAPKKTLRMQPA
ncbi:acyltransferase family protein [Methylobacterium brachythecii]|nr:acyltransferase family protein [Methylobacterium brachythecii]MBB3904537.1 putative membrane protein YcfT [Methylobacterium brachythecii]